jgi:hypothetical protein
LASNIIYGRSPLDNVGGAALRGAEVGAVTGAFLPGASIPKGGYGITHLGTFFAGTGFSVGARFGVNTLLGAVEEPILDWSISTLFGSQGVYAPGRVDKSL